MATLVLYPTRGQVAHRHIAVEKIESTILFGGEVGFNKRTPIIVSPIYRHLVTSRYTHIPSSLEWDWWGSRNNAISVQQTLDACFIGVVFGSDSFLCHLSKVHGGFQT